MEISFTRDFPVSGDVREKPYQKKRLVGEFTATSLFESSVWAHALIGQD
jgi:hypothetical protein